MTVVLVSDAHFIGTGREAVRLLDVASIMPTASVSSSRHLDNQAAEYER